MPAVRTTARCFCLFGAKHSWELTETSRNPLEPFGTAKQHRLVLRLLERYHEEQGISRLLKPAGLPHTAGLGLKHFALLACYVNVQRLICATVSKSSPPAASPSNRDGQTGAQHSIMHYAGREHPGHASACSAFRGRDGWRNATMQAQRRKPSIRDHLCFYCTEACDHPDAAALTRCRSV